MQVDHERRTMPEFRVASGRRTFLQVVGVVGAALGGISWATWLGVRKWFEQQGLEQQFDADREEPIADYQTRYVVPVEAVRVNGLEVGVVENVLVEGGAIGLEQQSAQATAARDGCGKKDKLQTRLTIQELVGAALVSSGVELLQPTGVEKIWVPLEESVGDVLVDVPVVRHPYYNDGRRSIIVGVKNTIEELTKRIQAGGFGQIGRASLDAAVAVFNSCMSESVLISPERFDEMVDRFVGEYAREIIVAGESGKTQVIVCTPDGTERMEKSGGKIFRKLGDLLGVQYSEVGNYKYFNYQNRVLVVLPARNDGVASKAINEVGGQLGKKIEKYTLITDKIISGLEVGAMFADLIGALRKCDGVVLELASAATTRSLMESLAGSLWGIVRSNDGYFGSQVNEIELRFKYLGKRWCDIDIPFPGNPVITMTDVRQKIEVLNKLMTPTGIAGMWGRPDKKSTESRKNLFWAKLGELERIFLSQPLSAAKTAIQKWVDRRASYFRQHNGL